MARIERDRSISKVSRAAAEDAPGRDAGDEVDDDNDEEQLEGREEHVPLRLTILTMLVTSKETRDAKVPVIIVWYTP